MQTHPRETVSTHTPKKANQIQAGNGFYNPLWHFVTSLQGPLVRRECRREEQNGLEHRLATASVEGTLISPKMQVLRLLGVDEKVESKSSSLFDGKPR